MSNFVKKGRLINGRTGGVIAPNRFINKSELTRNKDTVPAILEVNELVIPRKYVPIVSQFLRSKGISFGNFS